MITVKIPEEYVVELLMHRVDEMVDSDDFATRTLWENFYKARVESGYFDEKEIDVKSIVDDDVINHGTVITRDDFSDYDIKDDLDDRIVCRYGRYYLLYEG